MGNCLHYLAPPLVHGVYGGTLLILILIFNNLGATQIRKGSGVFNLCGLSALLNWFIGIGVLSNADNKGGE